MTINNFFRHKAKPTPLPLRIEGVGTAPITPSPDDAEFAAKALLDADAGRNKDTLMLRHNEKTTPEKGSPAYYAILSSRIRETRATEARLATRYVAYAEQQLALNHPASVVAVGGALAEIEKGLYDRIDIIEREGGELKRRWQHCLATVTVRMMQKGLYSTT
ncbi:MAG: hypothetical protein IKQ37_03915 [Bacteroidaceae bacterium]|nr:hypothetical protein [Bacteroidaceae bacterium]